MSKNKSKLQEYNENKRIENKQEVRMIEQGYVDNVINTLDAAIEERKKDFIERLKKYSEDHSIEKEDKDGNKYSEKNLNPILIQKYFFQSINPLVNKEPKYSAEKLGIVWQLYEEMIMQINDKIGVKIPNLSEFCAFAGIRLSTFKQYKQSIDEDMRVVADKIEDECFDSNVTLAQMGMIRERSTVYRMKSEQEKIEKEQPIFHVHTEKVDITQINNRVTQLKALSEKKKKVIEGELVNEQ